MSQVAIGESMETTTTEYLDACPNCNGTSWKTLPVPGNWIGLTTFGDLHGKIGLVRCRDCQLKFTNPRPSSERLSAFYSGDTYICHDSAGSASAGAKAEYLLNQITRYLPSQSQRNLLDYGAGGGGFLCHARARGWNVRGFEPGKRGLESCQNAGLEATDRLEELPAESFDLVTLHHVFEHLADPTEVLDGIRTLLAPQGRVYVEVPNANSLRACLSNPILTRWFSVDERYRAYPIHLFYYTDQTIRQAFKKAGWEVETTFTVGLGLDEYIVRRQTLKEPSPRIGKPGSGSPSAQRRLRHSLRDSFLRLGLGENLAVIAYPSGSCSRLPIRSAYGDATNG
jgi:SAM-dependent methyltransferase